MPFQNAAVKYLVNAVEENSEEFEAGGRVLRLKQYLGINARPPVLNAVLDALMKNTRVEALYIQNFEDVRPPPSLTPSSSSGFPLISHSTKTHSNLPFHVKSDCSCDGASGDDW